jgi:hypothetical protein
MNLNEVRLNYLHEGICYYKLWSNWLYSDAYYSDTPLSGDDDSTEATASTMPHATLKYETSEDC